jgi:hypothetical protein
MTNASQEVMTQSVLASGMSALSEISWQGVNEPGAYVERKSGDLYRIPKEALTKVHGGSVGIIKESSSASILAKLSDDPFISSFNARLVCAQHNIKPNF